MTLIIDNYDSFTWNLVHLVAAITGRMPIVVRNDEMTWEEIGRLDFSHVIISPGPGRPDNPRDFGVSLDAIRKSAVPVLGVCLGHQGIACAFGGSVVRGEPVHGKTAEIVHRGDPLFAGIPERFSAIRYHSLVVEEPLPEELRGIAWSGDGTLMALRHVSRPLWGVQFHPESILTEYGGTLLRNFLATGATAARSVDATFWLDDWNGKSYIGTGPAGRYTFDSLERTLREHRGEPGGLVGYITYEGEAIFVRHDAPGVEAPHRTPARCGPPRNLRYSIPRAAYLERVRECLELIAAGESYEICLTNKLLLESDMPALDYFRRLRQFNPAPYAAYLRFGDIEIACSSPECFLRIDPQGQVESRPIKGTLPRDRDPRELTTSERFRAENLMIVDLVRHDLSRVCEVGSVQVPRLMEVESYATVHQLVSTITGQLRPDATAVDCIRAAFPGGSMTGAPKKRTMELLRRLEPDARGIYSGSIGYLGFDGSADLNIVIRTAVFDKEQVSIGVGGAIVAQSEPEAEWNEIELKAQALLRAFEPD